MKGGAVRGRQGYAWVSPDFDRWLPALAEAFALPEPANPADRGASKPYDQVHLGVGATSFGSVVVGLYGIWHERGPNSSGASCDLGLVVSNDGIHFREPVKGFVYMSSEKSRATPVPGKSYPTNLCAGNGILNVGDETRIYYGRWRNAPVGDDYYGEVALARLPRDRWGAVGLAPRATEGEIWSAPLRIPTGGCRVALNAEGARGMSVELADDRFRPLEGFSGAASATPKTDSGLDCPVRWLRGLESLAGQTVRLHIRVGKQGGVAPRLYAVYLRSGK